MNAFEFQFNPQPAHWNAGTAPRTIKPEFVENYFKDAAINRRTAVLTVIEEYPRVELRVYLNEEVTLRLAPLKGNSSGLTSALFSGHNAPLVEWEDCWQAVAIGAAIEREGQKKVGEGIWWEAMKRSREFREWVADCFPYYWSNVKTSFEAKD